MVDVVFSGLKFAYQCFQGYRNKMEEFAELAEDVEELQDRVDSVWVSVDRLTGALDEDLLTPLNMCKKHLEKVNKYIDKVEQFCASNKGKGNFKVVAIAFANQAIGALPDEMKGLATSMVGFFESPPDKEFATLADKMESRVSALTLAVTVQGLTGNKQQAPAQQAMMGSTPAPARPAQQAWNVPAKSVVPAPDLADLPQSPAADGPPSDQSKMERDLAAKMGAILQEDVQEMGSTPVAYRLRYSRLWGYSTWGVIVNGKPYLVIHEGSPVITMVVGWVAVRSVEDFYKPELRKICISLLSSYQKPLQAYVEQSMAADPEYAARVKGFIGFPMTSMYFYERWSMCTCFMCPPKAKPGQQFQGNVAMCCHGCCPYCGPFIAKVYAQEEYDLDTAEGVIRVNFKKAPNYLTVNGVEVGRT